MKHLHKALFGFGVSGWTKFTYATLHYVMEFSEVSVPFLNTAFIVQ